MKRKLVEMSRDDEKTTTMVYIYGINCTQCFKNCLALKHFPTWILDPFLQPLLQPPYVERFRGHSHQGHDLQKFFLPGLAELMNIVAT